MQADDSNEQSDDGETFYFVNENPKNGKRRARAHTTKIVRRRKLQQSTQSTSSRESSTTTEAIVTPTHSGVGGTPLSFEIGPSFSRTVSSISSVVPPGVSLFEPRSEAGESIHYYMTVAAPGMVGVSDRRARLEEAFEHPIVYHSLQYASVVHRSLLQDHVTSGDRRSMLHHKVESLHLLRRLVEALDERDLQLIVFAITSLLRDPIEPDQHDSSGALPFAPIVPSACWLNVLGKTTAVEAHLKALIALVKRVGGLRKLPVGLARPIRTADIIHATVTCSKPLFSWSTDVDEEAFAKVQRARLPGQQEWIGRGFFSITPEDFPEENLSVYSRLATVEKLLPFIQGQALGDEEFGIVTLMRNYCQHRLLSLPRWDELTVAEKAKCSRLAYESCRLTSLLYSVSVIFAIPPRADCHSRLVEQLRQALETAGAGWAEVIDAKLMVWCLFVGAIAAGRSTHRPFFEEALRTVLVRAHITTFAQAKNVLTAFMWSHSACGYGAAMLWDAVGTDRDMP